MCWSTWVSVSLGWLRILPVYWITSQSGTRCFTWGESVLAKDGRWDLHCGLDRRLINCSTSSAA